MDSTKTKSKSFVKTDDRKCIAQMMAIAEAGGFRLYVSWKWEEMAAKTVYGFCKSRILYTTPSWEDFIDTAEIGSDIGGTGEEKKVFKNMF
ncbi:MAG: hypothetical protein ACKO1F_13420 [Flammeovirgaceae bacterium]